MDKHIKRFQLAVQALIYTGLFSVALESGMASAQRQSSSPPPAVEKSQPANWLLPIGGVSVLAISFGIEIYRHRCILGSAAEEDVSVSAMAAPSEQQQNLVKPNCSHPTHPLREY